MITYCSMFQKMVNVNATASLEPQPFSECFIADLWLETKKLPRVTLGVNVVTWIVYFYTAFQLKDLQAFSKLHHLRCFFSPLQILLILNIFLWELEVVVGKETSLCFKCVNWRLCREEHTCTPSPVLNKDSKYSALWDPGCVLKRETWCQALPQSNTKLMWCQCLQCLPYTRVCPPPGLL